MTLNCFKCHAEVVFDSDHIGKNGKKIPLDPLTKTPHDCPMREKRTPLVDNVMQLEEKNDHGNETFHGRLDDEEDPPEQKYVDHTAKPQLKLKTVTDPTPEGMDLKYNALAKEYNVKFSQYHPLGSLYTIAVYYEETK